MNSLEIIAIGISIIGTPLIFILLYQIIKNFRESGLL